jgi:hypothetical protein
LPYRLLIAAFSRSDREIAEQPRTAATHPGFSQSGNRGSNPRNGSLAPHLHFHVAEGASAVTDDGYPNTFSSFGQNGTVTQEQLLGLIGGTAPLPMSLLMNPVPHLKELPLNVTLNVFPTQGG